MTVIAALWHREGRSAGPICATMLRAQCPSGGSENLWSDRSIALGAAPREATVSDRGSALEGSSGAFVLAADARLDNREDFLAPLGLRGADKAVSDDARLMMLCFERWGAEVIARFVGDFAVALWDKREERLLLARDFAGQRPLHFHEGRRRGVAVASMAKGLHALDFVPRAVDETRLLETLAGLHHEGRRTFFKDVQRVEPGELMIFGRGASASRIFWTAPTGEIRFKSHADYAEALLEKLDGAVDSQLRGAGAAVATHLSAGLDSSAVTSSAAIRFGGRVLAFTSVPPHDRSALPSGRFGSEGALAARTAALYPNVEHRLIETPERLPLEDLDWELELFERPDLNLPNLAWANRINDAVAAEGVNVLLVGTGGNLTLSYAGLDRLGELLAGGRLAEFVREWGAARKHGIRSRAVLGLAAHQLLPGALIKALGPLRNRKAHPATAGMLNPGVPGVDEVLARHGRYDDPDSAASARSRAHMIRRVDPGTYNKGILLRWNIDVRDPTMDRRLVEFCLQVPLAHYFRNGMPRALARTALAGRVPDPVRLETRRGLQAPHWLAMIFEAREEAGRLLAGIGGTPLARELLDLPGMHRLLAEWPDAAARPAPHVYRSGLIRGLAAGEFIRLNSASATRSIDLRSASP